MALLTDKTTQKEMLMDGSSGAEGPSSGSSPHTVGSWYCRALSLSYLRWGRYGCIGLLWDGMSLDSGTLGTELG